MLTKHEDVYTLEKDGSFVKFRVDCKYPVHVEDKNINDGVIFWNGPLPTLPEDEYCIIGTACKFENGKCVDSALVGATILETNADKSFLECYFA